MLGAVLSWRCLGRHRLRCQPCSRIGENPPYGMIGGIEETSASSKPDPRLDPTRLRGARDETRVPTATFLTGLRPTLEDETQVIDSTGVFGCIFFINGASSSFCSAARRRGRSRRARSRGEPADHRVHGRHHAVGGRPPDWSLPPRRQRQRWTQGSSSERGRSTIENNSRRKKATKEGTPAMKGI